MRSRLVAGGHDVAVIGRGPDVEHPGWRDVNWSASTIGPWINALDGADVIVHLAGKRVDCRPTRSNIDELIASRENTVRLVGRAIGNVEHPPKAWVQLSSLAIFGDRGDDIITESTPVTADGPRQQVEVCRRWEAAFDEATAGIDRAVLLRPGIAIGGADDPASRQLARLAQAGLAGRVGSGRQWVSWIGADDLFGLLHRAVTDASMRGLYHLTGPEPVRNTDLMAAYRAGVGRRFGLPAPRAVTTIGAWLLGSDPALALTGRRCVPQRLLDEGHTFNQTDLAAAVRSALAAARR